MLLSFYARGTDKVRVPGSPVIIGQAPSYVGRRFLIGSKTQGAAHPATDQPFTCDRDSEAGRRLVKLCAKGSLWPADSQTAKACGVPHAKLEFKGGEWLPEKPKTSRRSTPRGDDARASVKDEGS